MTSADLVAILNASAGHAQASEAALSELIESVLQSLTLDARKEVWLNSTDRIDYMVGRVGIELKVKGSVSSITRQLSRYAQSPQVDELILVTTRMQHRSVPASLNQKTITVVTMGGYL
jgi:hypothetical protein